MIGDFYHERRSFGKCRKQRKKKADEINEVRQELQNYSGTLVGFSEDRGSSISYVNEDLSSKITISSPYYLYIFVSYYQGFGFVKNLEC